jgi:ketosteroid isomerase-like protein
MFSGIDIGFRGVDADDDVVIVEERMRATLAGGARYANDYSFVFTVAGDKIREVREYVDTRKRWRMVFGEEAR